MNNRLTDLFGIDFPLFGFSHCRDVVAAVTNAGGLGVLGAAALGPDQLDTELAWLDAHLGGRPYGVDVLVSEPSDAGRSPADLAAAIPDTHLRYLAALLERHGLALPDGGEEVRSAAARLGDAVAVGELLEVAFAHPVAVVANALGPPPGQLLERARRARVPVAALVGTRRHAERQLAAGVDLLVAQGGEAGGHTGEVSTMVLVPEVVAAAGGRVPVLAAGGIVTGRQVAAAIALGADGAWTGSVWLTTEEAETAPATKAKLLAAGSHDTVRSRGRTGKPARQLRSAWTEAWDDPDGPGALPMPLQSMLAEPALRRVDTVAGGGHPGARELATYFVGQGVGMLDQVRPARVVVAEIVEDFLLACGRITEMTDP